ncbi:MAG TPA: PilX N-terminal domain-containing pilus assembly protein [Rhodanobacter sp.]|jgi:type IV pilus assembly protein PilX|nr:PilX N-terminal domain-containing pilus assembly protein [Rhodanobacter sp.]
MSNTHSSIRSLGGARIAQRGVVLVVALIFLLLLSIIAVAASSRSLLQERMAGGLLNAQRAQMSAQTALRGAEWKLFSGASTSGIDCGGSAFPNCYKYVPLSPNTDVVNFRTKSGWVTAGSAEYLGPRDSMDYTATTTDGSKLANNPRYIIEDLGLVVPPASGLARESGDTGAGSKGAGNGGESEMYRITARATGGDKNTVVVLESTFDAGP